ncbi:hypothetical protein BJ170DRAFT_630636 [Xylariales sp. AK1849]|nr:hypothetical protein BJ170DRAFT_630636 [Xylariales sp. AK1849]
MPSSGTGDLGRSSRRKLPPGWSDHMLRKKYRDPVKLKNYLDTVYGEGQYQISIKKDRWIIALPKQMTSAELQELEESLYHHYDPK